MPMNQVPQEMLQEAIENVAGKSQLPAKHLFTVIKQFKEAVATHEEQVRRQEAAASNVEAKMRDISALISRYDSMLSNADSAIARLSQVKQGNPGKDADEDAIVQRVLAAIPKPQNGKDARLPAFDAIVEAVAKRIPAPKAPKVPTVEQILSKIRKEYPQIKDWREVPGLENEIASYRNQLAGKVYGKDTWARGAGTTVSAGSNITLVPQSDGTVQINASGGGSGTNVTTQYQLTALAAGTDATIDLTQLTNYATFSDLIAVYQNNIMLTEGLNFTVAGDTVTVINGTDADIYNVTYAYA